MLVRGAPLIGVTGAYGVFLAAKENKELKFIEDACDYLNSARPTAVNLSWALNRMLQKAFDSKPNNIIENLCTLPAIYLSFSNISGSLASGAVIIAFSKAVLQSQSLSSSLADRRGIVDFSKFLAFMEFSVSTFIISETLTVS